MMRSASLLCAFLATAACGSEEREAAVEVPLVSRREQALALHESSLARELSHDPANLKRVQLGSGIKAVRVESGFRHVTMVKRERDGGVQQGCVNELPAEVAR